MHRSLRFALFLVIGGAAIASLSQGCGGASDSGLFVPNGDDGGGGDDAATSDGAIKHDASTGDASTGDAATGDASTGDGSAMHDSAPTCTGLECQIARCDGGGKTTLTGIVMDPAKANPVYNAIVYVPNATVPDLPTGLSCGTCDTPPGGSPIVVALTGADGSFRLDDVPWGTDIPLVVQIGKWRRIVKVPRVDACATTNVDKELTRLPKSKAEGNLPHIAIATGGCDQLECLLRKMGVADSEFTAPNGNGSIHLYQGMSGGSVSGSPPATALWSSATELAKYDMVLNGCECQAGTDVDKPRTSRQNMADYARQGGRWLGTHYQKYWLDNGPHPIPSVATFGADGFGTDQLALTVSTSTPKGGAFAAWLVATGASTMSGTVTLDTMRHNVSAVTPPSTAWLSGRDTTVLPPEEVALFSFNAPFPAASLDGGVTDGGDGGTWGDAGSGPMCGKVAFADFHASLTNATPGPFPGECTTTAMSHDELALEFTIFDLGACVQDDTMAPKPPPLR